MMNIGPAAKETALQLLMLIILKVIAPCLPKSELCGGRVCFFPGIDLGRCSVMGLETSLYSAFCVCRPEGRRNGIG